jgi:hypothetical protein
MKRWGVLAAITAPAQQFVMVTPATVMKRWGVLAE